MRHAPPLNEQIRNVLVEDGDDILNVIQAALDVAGIEPTVGTAADGVNTVISLLRAAATKETDQRKKHLINAGISAISLVPLGDAAKLLKLRKAPKALTKGFIKTGQGARKYSKAQKLSGTRFGD